MNDPLRRKLDWNSYWFPESTGYNLAICRITVVSCCLLFFFPPLQTHLELIRHNDGFLTPTRVQQTAVLLFGEANWRSIPVLTTVHWVTLSAGLLTIVGFYTRCSSAVFAIGYLLLVTHRWAYGSSMEIGPIKPVDTIDAIFFLLLPFSPCGRQLSIDAWRAHRHLSQSRAETSTDAMWVLKLTGLLLAMIYLNTGWSKLLHGGPMWLNGYPVRNMNFVRGILLDLPLPIWISRHLILCQLISILVIGFELFFITGLIWKRTLPFWLACGAGFHLFTFFVYRNHDHFLSWIVIYTVYVDFEVLRNPPQEPQSSGSS